MFTRSTKVVLSVAAMFALASCGDDAVANPPDDPVATTELPVPDEPSADRCDPTVPDCDDTPGDGTQSVEEPSTGFDPNLARADAQYLLGLAESDIAELTKDGLTGEVRVGRRGDEVLPLTEDYVNGRKTVELDAQDGVFIVTSVTVELPDGPETFTR